MSIERVPRASAADAVSLRALALHAALGRPVTVAIDGRSGVGKSTFARELAALCGASIVDGDGFFSGGIAVRDDDAESRARACIDWRAQRIALASLRRGAVARYHAFDWDAFDGRAEGTVTEVPPRPIVIVEGVYAARPELHDLLDLRVLVRTPDPVRLARLRAREGGIGRWENQWLEAEEHYFAASAPERTFDVIVEG